MPYGRIVLGRMADHHHVENDEREAHQRDETRNPIKREDDGKQGNRENDDRRYFGDDKRHVRTHIFNALNNRRRYRTCAKALHQRRAARKRASKQRLTQLFSTIPGIGVKKAVLRRQQDLPPDKAPKEQREPSKLVGKAHARPRIHDDAR